MSIYQYTSKRKAKSNPPIEDFHKPAKTMVKTVLVRSTKNGAPQIMTDKEALALKAANPTNDEIVIFGL